MKLNELESFTSDKLNQLTKDLNALHYTNDGDRLTWGFSPATEINAWADSFTTRDQPAYHSVTLTQQLVLSIHRDIEDYLCYLESHQDDALFCRVFDGVDHLSSMLNGFTREQCFKNIYLAAIVWIYYHELGHLSQEHGLIRKKYVSENTSKIAECFAHSREPLTGKAAAIFHTTEIAADFYSVVCCCRDLTQADSPEIVPVILHHLFCGITLAIHRFHGDQGFIPQPVPEGKHPKPLVRLELMYPLVAEVLSSGLYESRHPDFDKKNILEITSQSAFTVALFWLKKKSLADQRNADYFLQSILFKPGVIDYLKIIIDTWDEIEDEILSLKRFGDFPFILTFSDQLRERAGCRINKKKQLSDSDDGENDTDQ